MPREEALVILNWCQVVAQFADTAFTADPVSTTLAAAFTHRKFHGMELVPDPAVVHLEYVAKCPQLEVHVGAVFTETLPEVRLHHCTDIRWSVLGESGECRLSTSARIIRVLLSNRFVQQRPVFSSYLAHMLLVW